MIEKAYRFGEEGNLVGVLCDPGSAARDPERPGVLILTAGVLHRVGPYRLHVLLARRLAREGFVSLRFDLSGVGDSAPRGGARSSDAHRIEDIREAMDFMERRLGCNRFAVMGLCSGAKNAHNAALADERVCGAVFIDGFTYATWRQKWRYYAPRALRLRSWTGFARRALARRALARGGGGGPQGGKGNGLGALISPPKEETAADLAQLAARGVAMLYVYSGESETYNYPGQLRDAFRTVDFRGTLDVAFFREADHTFTRARDRNLLTEKIAEWAGGRFEASPSPSRATPDRAD